MDTKTAIDQARRLLKSGDFVGVYDTVQRALESCDFDPALAHLALLSLARSGATRQALEYFEEVRDHLPRNEDFLSLEARLYKDLFLNEGRRHEWGKKARDLYAAAFEVGGSYYPAINDATLSLLIGDRAASNLLAQHVLSLCDKESLVNGPEDYYVHATRAEACLLLEEDQAAHDWLQKARQANPLDLGNFSTTYKQLKLICDHRGVDVSLLNPIQPPTVITYTGQMIHGIGKSPGIDPQHVAGLERQIAETLEQQDVHIAYGSLACGADLMVAQAILDLGGELNVILPFGADEFKAMSVSPGGKDWDRRFDAVMQKAASVSCVVQDGMTGYDLLFEACSRQAMGMAHLRSRLLGSRAFQLAVWNGLDSGTPAGTAGAMQRGEAVGMENRVIRIPDPEGPGVISPAPSAPATPALSRKMKAMIFADVKGFSSLEEKQLPEFVPRWMDALDRLRQSHDAHIQYINTWGDAAYLVLEGATAAARAALEMAGLFDDWDTSSMGLSSPLGLRVAAHIGPVFETHNPLLGRPDFFGPHVNQTARLEPCTPVGSVYVTEPFAAAISLEGRDQYRCEYVGNHPLPKNFGRIRMYHLTENHHDAA